MRLILTLIAIAGLGTATAGELAPVAPAERHPSTERVVALEFLETEILLALGVTPVAVADPDGYRRWVGVLADRLAGATPLGTRQEPSLERLAAASPTLVVGSHWRHGAIAERLQGVAPTLLYDDLPRPEEADQYRRMTRIVRDLGARLKRAARATTLLDDTARRLERHRAALAEADTTAPVILAQQVPGTERFRLFTANSLAVQVAQRLGLGLPDARDGAPAVYGFRVVRLDRLLELPPASHLLLVTDREAPAFRRVAQSPVWRATPFVREDRLHFLPTDTWFFGGPLSVQRLADRIAAALLDTGPD